METSLASAALARVPFPFPVNVVTEAIHPLIFETKSIFFFQLRSFGNTQKLWLIVFPWQLNS